MRQMAREGIETLPAAIGGAPTRARPKPLSRGFSLALAVLLLAALVLRLLAARGELWVDEIWSLNLVAPLRSAGEVFWGISHDNNHFLNSLWLYAAGPGRTAIVYRLPAVLLGTLSVLVAARIGLRRDPATGVAAALLTAFSFTLVNYGSEARGYAGLVLAIFIAIDAFEQAMAARLTAPVAARGSAGGGHRWVLGLAVGFGMLSHLTMLSTVAVLALVAAIRLVQAGRRPGDILDELVRLFAPSALLMLPALAALAGGVAMQGGFTLGGAEPFVLEQFIAGYGNLLRFMTGLPAFMPFWAVFALCGAAVVLARRNGLVDPARLPLLAMALVLLPAIMVAARLPNLEFPRYYMVSAVVVVLGLADAIGRLWQRAGTSRQAAAVLLACVLAGQAVPLSDLLNNGRGSYSAALALIGREGGPTYASNRGFATGMVVGYLDAKPGASVVAIKRDAFCARPPDWFIDSVADDTNPAERIEAGPAGCRTSYGLRQTYPASALSGLRWTLYRR